MPGTLYVVATPIGNLEDVTFRALRTLREVSLIAAEDTRRTGRLLQHYSISTPTTSLHEHNERAKSPMLIRRLIEGESIALVADAGTPGLSDPGAGLVAAAHDAGIRVEPVPGPSAALAALSASGFSAAEWLFVGFPPPKAAQRKAWLTRLAREPRGIILYEAPHRIRATLAEMEEILGNRSIALCKELTKVHEKLVIRPIVVHRREMSEPRGEYTLVVPPTDTPKTEQSLPGPRELAAEFGEITNSGAVGRRGAVRMLAQKYAVSVKEVYQRVQEGLDEDD